MCMWKHEWVVERDECACAGCEWEVDSGESGEMNVHVRGARCQ